MKTEIICDTNIFYNYRSLFRAWWNNYLPSFYNFEDLLASKKNISDIDNRLNNTIRSKLKTINNHEVLIFEPHYYIIKDIFPDSKIRKPLFDRIDTTTPFSYINCLSTMLSLGDQSPVDLKAAVSSFAQQSTLLKQNNLTQTVTYAKHLYNTIGYHNKAAVRKENFYPHVEDLLISQLNLYANKYMLNTSPITRLNLNLRKYELFIKTFSRYLAGIVGPENENPALNDNVDSLLLLYVYNGRKFMTCEKKWLHMIKSVNLHKKYLCIYSTSFLSHACRNIVCLKIFGIIKYCHK